ncbi:hypothetical protein [Nostoc sp.]|uniref:hypothetical protein n=1 Tax=Nostoc sp. TaxID=1180 RepID=UPI002FF9FC8F
MLKIRDLDCQQSYLESLNDEKAENLVVGAGTTIIAFTTGSFAAYDDTGASIDARSLSTSSISLDPAGNKIVTAGTLIQAIVKPSKKN